ncbi:hypothetical protein ACOSP7_031478 [Xanthoceras sorbifolium]
MSSSRNDTNNTQNTPRSASYSNEEDQLLCHIYLDVSQNPIIGRDQFMQQFWSRIETEYHKALPVHITIVRPWRSLQKRMQVIMAAIGKLRGCIRQIEYLKPSGASEQDVLNQAKALLAQDPKFKKGFKFDHMWPLLKDTEKFADVNTDHTPSRRKRNECNDVSQSDSTKSTPGASSFCIDLNVDFESEEQINDNNDPFERPIGRKKEKMKRKQVDEMTQFYKSFKEENQEMKGIFKESNDRLQESKTMIEKNYELQLLRAQNEIKNIELKERCREDNFLLKDVNSIEDPMLREIDNLKVESNHPTHSTNTLVVMEEMEITFQIINSIFTIIVINCFILSYDVICFFYPCILFKFKLCCNLLFLSMYFI